MLLCMLLLPCSVTSDAQVEKLGAAASLCGCVGCLCCPGALLHHPHHSCPRSDQRKATFTLSEHKTRTKLAICIVLNQQCMTLNDNKDAHRPLFASQSIMEADHAFTCHDTAIFILLLCRPTWLEMSMSCLCSVPCIQAL